MLLLHLLHEMKQKCTYLCIVFVREVCEMQLFFFVRFWGDKMCTPTQSDILART